MGFLTVLKQDDSGGLQVKCAEDDSRWIDVPPVPHTLPRSGTSRFPFLGHARRFSAANSSEIVGWERTYERRSRTSSAASSDSCRPDRRGVGCNVHTVS